MLSTSGSSGVLTAPKGFLGEGFGSTSSALVVIGTLALERGIVPPSAAADRDLAPEVVADRLPIRPEKKQIAHVLVVGSTRPGRVTALLLSRPTPRGDA
jgi:3-oxoacyl-(acyl-carrier-protein) synthase